MAVLALSRDAQAIALLCSRLAMPREGGPKPFGWRADRPGRAAAQHGLRPPG